MNSLVGICLAMWNLQLRKKYEDGKDNNGVLCGRKFEVEVGFGDNKGKEGRAQLRGA